MTTERAAPTAPTESRNAPSTAPASAPTSSTTAPPTSTPTFVLPIRPGSVVLGVPNPALLPSEPASGIDWSAVGAGWLLVDHIGGDGNPSGDPTSTDGRGLYLVAPDDTLFAASALPTDGSRVADVSDDGRLALIELVDNACAEGCTCPDDAEDTMRAGGFAVVELTTSERWNVVDPVTVSVCGMDTCQRTATFGPGARSVWVLDTWYENFQVVRVRAQRIDVHALATTTLLDEQVVPTDETTHRWVGIGLLELGDGRVVTATPSGVRIWDAIGRDAEELDAPVTGCTSLWPWDAEHLLARCIVPTDEFPPPSWLDADQCSTSGLWLVSLDGSASRPFAVNRDADGALECWAGYVDAVRLGDQLAVQVAGDGCTDGVDIIGPDGDASAWLPEVPDVCTETLLGQRNGAWLIAIWSETGSTGIYEVTVDGEREIDLPTGTILPI